jgi:hypothetical protein
VWPLFRTPGSSETDARYKYVLEMENVFLKLSNDLENLELVELAESA